MKISDEIVQEALLSMARDNVGSDVQGLLVHGFDKLNVKPNALRNALSSVLPKLMVKVPELDWEQDKYGAIEFTAQSIFGEYSVFIKRKSAYACSLDGVTYERIELNNPYTLNEAKLATQKEINANLMGDDEDKPRYTTKRLKLEIEKAVTAKLAQLKAQEPVAYLWRHPDHENDCASADSGANLTNEDKKYGWMETPLYAAPVDQTAEIERLREALQPFAEYMHTDDGRIDLNNQGQELPDNDHVGWVYLTHGHFRAARAALSGKSPT